MNNQKSFCFNAVRLKRKTSIELCANKWFSSTNAIRISTRGAVLKVTSHKTITNELLTWVHVFLHCCIFEFYFVQMSFVHFWFQKFSRNCLREFSLVNCYGLCWAGHKWVTVTLINTWFLSVNQTKSVQIITNYFLAFSLNLD